SVAVADARQVADDFLLLRTTAASAARFWRLFPPEPLRRALNLESLSAAERVLILGSAPPPGQTLVKLTIYDGELRVLLEAECETAAGYGRRGGGEDPAAGLRVVSPTCFTWLPGLSQTAHNALWSIFFSSSLSLSTYRAATLGQVATRQLRRSAPRLSWPRKARPCLSCVTPVPELSIPPAKRAPGS